MKALCATLARMTLRQDDAIRTLQLDTSFVIWLRVGIPANLPEGLRAVSIQWKAQKAEGKVTTSLRQVLWLNLWGELERRLNPSSIDEAQRKILTSAGFMTLLEGSHVWPYLVWDQKDQKLQVDSSRKGLGLEEAHQLVAKMLKLTSAQPIVTRFHPTRPLAAEMRGTSLTFLASISNRSEMSDQVFQILTTISSNGLTQIGGMSLRPERLSRSPLAVTLGRQLAAVETER